MSAKKLVQVFGVCLAICFLLGVLTAPAFALKGGGAAGLGDVGGGGTGQGDKNLADKKGLAVLSGAKEIDQTRVPNFFKKALGIGSFVVMIAVVKWL